MADRQESADAARGPGGRQYHIGLGPGDVAPSILLVGDPERARRAADRLSPVRGSWQNREYLTFTGEWGGIPITVMATGIGCDNTEIAVVELSTLVDDAVLIRAGTCGALQPGIDIGDLIITWGAVRLESTSLQFVPEGYPAASHPEVAAALRAAAERLGAPHHFGMTATASGFYGAQGREVPGFPLRRAAILDELIAIGVKNMEMEASTLLTLASLRGFRAGAVCTVFANRHHNRFVDPAKKKEFEDRAVLCGLEALKDLAAKSSTS